MTKPARTIDIAEFEAFCRSKPEGEEYDPVDGEVCALAQFAKSLHSPKEVFAGFIGYDVDGQPFAEFPKGVDGAGVICSRPHTFSALADRLAAIDTEDV